MSMNFRWIVQAGFSAACVAVAGTGAASADRAELRSEPEVFQAAKFRPVEKAFAVQAETGAVSVSRRIELPPLAPEELAPLNANNANHAAERGSRALQAGVTRVLSVLRGEAIAGGLRWENLASGERVARLEVASPGASALRVAIAASAVPAGARFWFHGNAAGTEKLGPIPSGALSDGKSYWSPVVLGDVATLEIQLPAGADPQMLDFAVPRVSHLVYDPARNEWQKSTGIGSAAGCAPDVVCTQPDAAVRAASSGVARMIFTRPEGSYLCSGTLIADKDPTSQIPYFLTANHCISDEDAARTLNTYWFFEAAICGTDSTPALQQRYGGASLQATDEALDNTLLRLKDDPPAGVTLSGFDANPIANPVAAIGIHHPRGDLKKLSSGAAVGYGDFNGQGSFVKVQWDRGVTEGGSSGSGIFTFANGAYYLRGALKGGSSYCDNPTGYDLYSRLDLAWPALSPFLGAGSSGTTVVEYHAGGDRYFLTGLPEEIAALDDGTIPGWARTGQSFLAYNKAGDGLAEVCRFFGNGGGEKNAHFYTAFADECSFLKTSTYWLYEGVSFYAGLPTGSGQCLAGDRPLYRLYNNAKSGAPMHRYTTSGNVRSQMIAEGWSSEGLGGSGVVACVR